MTNLDLYPTTPHAIALDAIYPSPTNPRRHFDAAALDELAGSIRAHGVLQPILVRPWPKDGRRPPANLTFGDLLERDVFELVAGERRVRASKLAEQTSVVAIVRELTDLQVLEIQIIENLQREGLHPLEEAAGYQRLMSEGGYTAEQLGQKIGKSTAYVYARLKLCALVPAAREAFFAGLLNPSTALLIARIPPSLQEQARKEITDHYEGPLHYREAARHIQSHYMLRLAEATFPRADADLVPSAGRCQDCPKRSGCQPELFADVSNADLCTDPECFAAKKAAHAKRLVDEAIARGQKVIDGKAAQAILPTAYADPKGYTDLDAKCYTDGKHRTYRQILGTAAPEATVIVSPHDPGKVIQAVPTATIAEQLEAKGLKLSRDLGNSAAEKEKERRARRETAYRTALFDAIRSRLTQDLDERGAGLEPVELLLVAQQYFQISGFESEKRIAKAWHGPSTAKQDDHALIHEFRERIPRMTPEEHCRLILELALVSQIHVSGWMEISPPDRLISMAEHLELDHEAIKREAMAEARAKAKPKPKPKAKPASKKAAKTPAKTAGKSKAKTKADPALAAPATEPAAPATASASTGDSALSVGDRVRVKNDTRGPNGRLRKCCGREGTITETANDGAYYTVRFGPRAHDMVFGLVWNELEKLAPAAPDKTAAATGTVSLQPASTWPSDAGAVS